MTCDEMITAVEHIFVVEVLTTSVAKPKKTHTSGPMDIRMAAKDDTSDAKSEEEQKYALHGSASSITKVQNTMAAGKQAKVKVWNWSHKRNQFGKGGRDPHRVGKNFWSEDERKKERTGQEKGGGNDSRLCWKSGSKGHLAALCPKNW